MSYKPANSRNLQFIPPSLVDSSEAWTMEHGQIQS